MLDKFIMVEAEKLFPELFLRAEYFNPIEIYRETVNAEALGDSWLENQTTYIYKVGVYIIYDENKMDWLQAFYGYQRYEKSGFEFLGYLKFPNGENDDMQRTLESIVRLINNTIMR